jgi:LPXTG-motif cell wall-anchored protein
VTTTSPGANVPGGANAASTTQPPTSSSSPTFASGPLTPPPVDALAAGQALPDPLPRVTAFVLDAHSKIVVLGVLSPDEVRMLFRELAERRLPHTGNDTGALVLVALLALVLGTALFALSGWRRERPGGDRTP